MEEERQEIQEQTKTKQEDYVVGCHNENYMVSHICPVATGGWCRDYVKCRSMEVTDGSNQ